MCLAVPMKVIEKNESIGKVQAGNVTYDANFTLLPEVKTGDYVLIHAGFAIEKLDVVEAEKTLDLFREMYENEENEENSV
jgi:hydrogenase expression/formation protein HypC